jgi:hypothetical protein
LISTISKATLSLLSVVLLSIAVCPAFAQESASIAEEIRQLGTGGDDAKIVAKLAETPQLSTKLLIEELHPVKEARILASEKKPDVEHVLWCIRALRFLTGGKDFCGKTAHQFGKSELERNRKYWVNFKYKKCASFFAMWPSRGSEYIAPEDAQKEIIDKWKGWFAKDGSSFDYKPLHDPKPEAWLW